MTTLSSMTGFGIVKADTLCGTLTVDIRSVNSRFLDLTLRLSDELRPFEGKIREALSKNIARGKVECRLYIDEESVQLNRTIDKKGLQELLELQNQVLAVLPESKPLTVQELLASPGVLRTDSPDQDKLQAQVMDALAEVLKQFQASRQREGAALGLVLANVCDKIDALVNELEPQLPCILKTMEAKLNERLEQALAASLSEASALTQDEVRERIRQEISLFGMKMDVQEEMDRLHTHTAEVRRIIDAGGAAGRRLDFLMQELNREANTLGSKAAAISMTDTSVNLKVLIEQLREQIQNLE